VADWILQIWGIYDSCNFFWHISGGGKNSTYPDIWWRLGSLPQVDPASSSTSCFGSSACLQSSGVLCKTAYGTPQAKLGGSHAEGAGHSEKLTIHGWYWHYVGGTHCWLFRWHLAEVVTVDRSVTSAPYLTSDYFVFSSSLNNWPWVARHISSA